MNDNPYESPRTNEADRLIDIPQGPPLIRLRYFVLAMLVLLSVVTYLDRICIGVAGTDIQRDLGLSKKQWSWVLGAFLLGYGLFEIPSGAIGDRTGQRKTLTRIVLWWSAFTALTPLSRNFYALVATRFFFGAGEAGAYPNASGCISRWFPAQERARAQGLIWGASRVGGALTPVIVEPLKNAFGWQACFWLFGAMGLIWAMLWYYWYRDQPAQHSAMTTGELAEIGRSPVASHSDVPWRRLFASPQLWLIMGMYWFYVFGFIFFFFWFPEYLTEGRKFSSYEKMIAVALLYSAGALGNLLGGWASDWLTKRHGPAIGRKVIGVSCLAACGILLFAAALTPGKYVVAGMMIAAFGIADAMLPCSWAICLDVGRQYSGAVSGAMNSAGQAAGYVATVLYGYLMTAYGYDRPLLFLAPNLLIAAVLFALIDPTRPLVDEPTESDSAE